MVYAEWILDGQGRSCHCCGEGGDALQEEVGVEVYEESDAIVYMGGGRGCSGSAEVRARG